MNYNNLRRLLATFLSVCMLMCVTETAFAATPVTNVFAEDDTLINVLYQDNNVLLYQSKESAIATSSEDNYGNVWLNSSKNGDFTVYNTCSGRTGVTWKVESSSNESYAQIWMTNSLGLTVLATRKVYPSNGDVHLILTNAVKGNYTVHYMAYTKVGMRIMCWFYQ